MRTALVLAAVILATPRAATAEHPGWRHLAPGLEHAVLLRSEGVHVPFRVQAFRVDLARFEPRVVLAKDFGAPIASATRMADTTGASLVVNGPFFDERDVPLGLLLSRGEVLRPLRRADWGVLFMAGGKAGLMHTSEWRDHAPPGATFAVQVGPRMVAGGRVLPLKPQVARRAAICVEPGGGHLVVIATDTGMAESNDLARLMADMPSTGGFGCTDALMMDGGPSAQLSARAGGTRVDVPGGRDVPAFVGFYAR